MSSSAAARSELVEEMPVLGAIAGARLRRHGQRRGAGQLALRRIGAPLGLGRLGGRRAALGGQRGHLGLQLLEPAAGLNRRAGELFQGHPGLGRLEGRRPGLAPGVRPVQRRGPGAVREAAGLPATALGGDPGRLEALRRRMLRRPRGLQLGPSRIHPGRETGLRLGGGLEPPFGRLQPPPGLPHLGASRPPGLAGQAPPQRGEPLRQAPHLQGRLALAGQLGQPGLGLAEPVDQPLHRDTHLVQPAQGVVAGDPERADAGRLLDQRAALPGGRLDDRLDVVLGHHRVAVLGQPGATQDPFDVAKPGAFSVDPVLDLAAAHHPAADGDLGILDRKEPVLVVEDQLDLGHPHPVTT